MKRMIILSLLAVAITGGMAVAGFKYVLPLQLDTTARFAQGTFADTRSSANSADTLGCNIYAQAGSMFMDCQACTNGACGYCYSYDPNIISALHMASNDSYVRFYWDEYGRCTQLTVGQTSMFAPKQP